MNTEEKVERCHKIPMAYFKELKRYKFATARSMGNYVVELCETYFDKIDKADLVTLDFIRRFSDTPTVSFFFVAPRKLVNRVEEKYGKRMMHRYVITCLEKRYGKK